MHLFKGILIIANSARMLAQAANSIGLRPLVIDCFGDLDTQGYAESAYQIPSLAKVHLIPALEQLLRQYAVTAVIYGSGFEYYPESLGYLAERFRLLGNDPQTFMRFLNKADFFTVLDSLAIAHPMVRFQPPESDEQGWLIKPMQGQGGVGVKRYQPRLGHTEAGLMYWQKVQAGTQQSVLFLVYTGVVQIIGFNTQWTIALSENQGFLFSGIMNAAVIPSEQATLINVWLGKLVKVFNLKGLNSMDFILADQACYVLEINPRPSASMQLYSPEWLLRHIQACGGMGFVEQQINQENDRCCLKLPSDKSSCAYQLVYAEQAVTIPKQFAWPEWCMDLPKAGAIIGTMQPICSIIAYGQSAQRVRKKLHTLQQQLLRQLSQGT